MGTGRETSVLALTAAAALAQPAAACLTPPALALKSSLVGAATSGPTARASTRKRSCSTGYNAGRRVGWLLPTWQAGWQHFRRRGTAASRSRATQHSCQVNVQVPCQCTRPQRWAARGAGGSRASTQHPPTLTSCLIGDLGAAIVMTRRASPCASSTPAAGLTCQGARV